MLQFQYVLHTYVKRLGIEIYCNQQAENLTAPEHDRIATSQDLESWHVEHCKAATSCTNTEDKS